MLIWSPFLLKNSMQMKKDNLYKFYLLVFGISWIGVLPSLLIAHGIPLPNVLKHFHWLMTLGPVSGALIYLYLDQGSEGVKSLFRKIIHFRVNGLVIVFTLIMPIILAALAAVIGLYFTETPWPLTHSPKTILGNAAGITVMYLLINTEEFAWRGVAFDKLFQTHGFFKACFILGPIWWLFHLPLFLYPDGHPGGYGISEFTLMVAGQTLLLGWIYIKSGRSLFYSHLYHQLVNGVTEAFPIFPVYIGFNDAPLWVYLTITLLVAAILLYFSPVKTPEHVT